MRAKEDSRTGYLLITPTFVIVFVMEMKLRENGGIDIVHVLNLETTPIIGTIARARHPPRSEDTHAAHRHRDDPESL